jgi:hypothetical protein
LDIAESLRALRREIHRDTGRDVEWELIEDGTLTPVLDKKKTTADRLLCHVPLPARGADDQAVKQVHTLHVRIKNEW